jgi:hemolysin III
MAWLHVREPVSAWTHFAWLIVALPALCVLWRLSGGSLYKRVGGAIFSLTLALCFTGSWLYHSVPADLARPFATLDHIGIYLFIAGTTTPIALVLLSGWWRRGLLALIWGLALAGVTVRLSVRPTVLQLTGFYLVMGWVGLATYFELARRLSHAALRPLWLGALCYSVGAVLNGLDWPVIVPGVFEAHEVFHLFVMAGSACHYVFMLCAVIPYQELVVAASPALPLAATMAVGPSALPETP